MRFDWGSVERGAYPMARATFFQTVAARIDGGEHLGFATQYLNSVSDPRRLLGDGWTVTSEWRYSYLDVIAKHESGATVCISRDEHSEVVDVTVCSTDGDEAERLVMQILGRAQAVQVEDDDVRARFWAKHPMGGGMSYVRALEAPSWDDHRMSYSADARARIESLMAWQGGPPSGRLLLFHGPAGTGKTSAIRMMGQAWKSWADIHTVIDPEEFFSHADYMTEVMLGDSGEGRWRIIVVEDADELISLDAKTRSGQATARLLNMSDGLLGQGLRVMTCITTNEPMDALHPAVLRSGRCAANVEVPALTAEEADEWRAGRALDATGDASTLADLWEEVRLARVDRATSLAASVGRLRRLRAV